MLHGLFPVSVTELKLRIFAMFFIFVLVFTPFCVNAGCLKSPRVNW